MLGRPSQPLVDHDAKWLHKAAGAFQNVVLYASFSPLDGQKLDDALSRLPVPSTPFERLVMRCFMCECLIGVLSSASASPSALTLRDFANLFATIRLSPNQIETFSKLLSKLLQGPDKHSWLVDEISRRLEREYALRLKADAIAHEYQISRAQLDRGFCQRFGVPFHEYLTTIRVRHGLALVRSGMKIEAAAPAVGYRSKKDFYRAVKLRTGFTPGQLRKSKDSQQSN